MCSYKGKSIASLINLNKLNCINLNKFNGENIDALSNKTKLKHCMLNTFEGSLAPLKDLNITSLHTPYNS